MNQLEYKILADASDNLALSDLLADPTRFVDINEFVSQGSAQVIEEDPIFAIPVLIAGGQIINGATYIIFNRPDLDGLTPRSAPGDLKDLTVAWIDDHLLAEHCGAVRASAQNNKIPSRLLASIVLNEMAGYTPW